MLRLTVRSFLSGVSLLAAVSPLSAQYPTSTDTFITPTSITVHAGEQAQFSVTRNGVPATNGYWYSNGTGDAGGINSVGLYTAPWQTSTTPVVTIGYFMYNSKAETQITITNPLPKLTVIDASSFTQISTPVSINGSGFLPTTAVYVQGRPMPTTFHSPNWLTSTVTLAAPLNGNVAVEVRNPDPGAATATFNVPAVFPTMQTISPTRLTGGWVTLVIGGAGYTSNTVVTLDGRPMKTTLNSATSLTAVGYLPPWRGAPLATITLLPETGSVSSAHRSLSVAARATSYDTAARFTTQAAFGPRPGLVENIQQVGLKGFLTEQARLPGATYPPGLLPRYPFLQAVSSGSSLLRLRVATALSSYIANQATFDEFHTYATWETKLEADALGNYRQLMTDIVSDPLLGNFLNLAGNYAPTDPSEHPNQNFAREFMQLFTIGTAMLNDDGTVQVDASGAVVPAYDLNTILDLSRALTGWNFGPVVNQTYVSFGIDFSQPLVGFDQYHDHGAKTLFGTTTLRAGLNIVSDRTAALNAIFNHPNVPPFVAQHLISQLVTSNPTPAYVARISAVFKNNGRGVRGDLNSVVQAILLDPEARAGDVAAQASSHDGFLQDPLLFEAFVMNVLQQTQWDGQPLSIPGKLGMDFWHPASVFAFYPAHYLIPGTTINSPQYSLLNNLTQVHRSQYLYGMIDGTTNGFGDAYKNTSWLFTAFSNVPDLVEALNHQLFHGTMPAATQSEILNYCSGIADQKQAFTAAIFLAMNSDSYNVVH